MLYLNEAHTHCGFLLTAGLMLNSVISTTIEVHVCFFARCSLKDLLVNELYGSRIFFGVKTLEKSGGVECCPQIWFLHREQDGTRNRIIQEKPPLEQCVKG